jgi:uncharacterized damage-inducible protein DinB
MPLSNPVEILLTHDRWATKNILQACEKLSADQFHQRFEMGPGSLHATIIHIIGAMRGWGDLLAQRPMRPRPDQDGTQLTPGELQKLLDESADDFAHSVRTHPPDEIVSRERNGKMYSFTRGAVLTHVTTHAMHHRAQCLNMLRKLGVAPLPPSSVMEWTFTE